MVGLGFGMGDGSLGSLLVGSWEEELGVGTGGEKGGRRSDFTVKTKKMD